MQLCCYYENQQSCFCFFVSCRLGTRINRKKHFVNTVTLEHAILFFPCDHDSSVITFIQKSKRWARGSHTFKCTSIYIKRNDAT